MTDGGVSHSSEIKLRTFRTVAVLDLFSLWVSSCFPFALCSAFGLFISIVISLPVGPHPPNG
jgi:hypothetical protein